MIAMPYIKTSVTMTAKYEKMYEDYLIRKFYECTF